MLDMLGLIDGLENDEYMYKKELLTNWKEKIPKQCGRGSKSEPKGWCICVKFDTQIFAQ